jgi:hypothetical protein
VVKHLRAEAWKRKKDGHLDDEGWERADELTKERKVQLERAAAPAEQQGSGTSQPPTAAPQDGERSPDGAYVWNATAGQWDPTAQVPDPSPPPAGEQSETTPPDAPGTDSAPGGAPASSPPAPAKAKDPVVLADKAIGSTGLRKALIDGIKSALLARGFDPDTYIAEWAGGPFDRVQSSDLRKLSSELAFVATQQVKP